MTARKLRHLVLLLGDQLSWRSVALEFLEASCDRILMAEVAEESEHVSSTKMCTAVFLSAMRHFQEELAAREWPLDYLRLGPHRFTSSAEALDDALTRYRPDALVMAEAGEWRLEQATVQGCGSMCATTSIS